MKPQTELRAIAAELLDKPGYRDWWDAENWLFGKWTKGGYIVNAIDIDHGYFSRNTPIPDQALFLLFVAAAVEAGDLSLEFFQ